MFFDVHEQRRFLRFDVNFPAQISFLPDADSSELLHLTGRILDISDAGFRMELDDNEQLSSGQHLDVILHPPGNIEGGDPVELDATLVWLDRDALENGKILIGAYLNELLDLDLTEASAENVAQL